MYKTTAAKRIRGLSNFAVRAVKYGPQNLPIVARVLTDSYNKAQYPVPVKELTWIAMSGWEHKHFAAWAHTF